MSSQTHVRTVVIVDDTVDIRLLVRSALDRRPDFEVVGEAEDGVSGIEVVRERHPDLVLLDISMPVLDGLSALPQILAACPGVQVVMLSGFGAELMAERCLAAGAAAYIQKGTPIRQLQALVEVDPPGADGQGLRSALRRILRFLPSGLAITPIGGGLDHA